MNHKNAGFGLRFLAFITEFCIFLFLHALFWQYISSAVSLTDLITRILIYFVVLVFSPLGLIYNLALTYYAGGTLGKLLTGLKIISHNGQKLSFKRVIFRQTIGYQFAALLFGAGFWAILKDPENRGWHDKAISSKVIITQSLWPLSTVAIIAFLLLSISTISTTLNNFKNSPTRFEIGSLARLYQVQQEIKNQEENQSTPSATPDSN
jgi:uncharacterized RDD family membrane protein YckC